MLRKILLTFFVVILIAGSILGYLYYMDLKKPVSPSIDAIPNDACMIIETKNFQKFWNNLYTTNSIWKEFTATETFKKLNNQLLFIDSIVAKQSAIGSILEKSPLYVSMHPINKSEFDYLFVLNVSGSIREQEMEELIKSNASLSARFEKRYFENVGIFEVNLNNGKTILSYCKFNGNFIASFSSKLIEGSILHAKKEKSIIVDKEFSKVYATIGSDVDIHFFIHHNRFNSYLKKYTNTNYSPDFSQLSDFAEWSAFDLNVKPNELSLDGFTSTNDSLNNYLKIFDNQSPQKMDVVNILPEKTAAFTFYGIENYKTFQSAYKKWLQKNSQLEAYNSSIKAINFRTGSDLELHFSDWIGNEAIVFMTEKKGTDSLLTAAAIKTTDIYNALNHLKEMSFNYNNETSEEEEDSSNLSEKVEKLKYDSEKSTDSIQIKDSLTLEKNQTVKFQIKQLKANGVLEVLFGYAFRGITENFYAPIGDYIVFANSSDELIKIHENYQAKKIIKQSESYQSFSDKISDASNIFCYANISKVTGTAINMLLPEYTSYAKSYLDVYNRFNAISIQFINKKNLYYTNIQLQHNPVQKKETKSIWEIELDAPVYTTPKVVLNHKDNSKEIIVQDNNKNLYLLSSKGELLWKVKLDEYIQSDIYQVDRYKNNKLQYVFNTPNKIHMIDRNGEFCDGFPLSLQYPATSSMIVFDYEKNRDYRFLISCNNNKVYNYKSDAEPVNGWEFEVMKGNILAQQQHFKIKDKDYIVVVDTEGNVKLIDRKGKLTKDYSEKFLINDKNNFYIELGNDLSSSKLISTDKNGTVQLFYLDNKLQKIKLKSFSVKHYFECADINKDGSKDYIVADNNELNAYDQSSKLLFNYKFKNNISEKPIIFEWKNDFSTIGVISALSKEIYMLSHKGSLLPGFPLFGSTPFCINNIYNDNNSFVIVGSTDKQVYTYALPEE